MTAVMAESGRATTFGDGGLGAGDSVDRGVAGRDLNTEDRMVALGCSAWGPAHGAAQSKESAGVLSVVGQVEKHLLEAGGAHEVGAPKGHGGAAFDVGLGGEKPFDVEFGIAAGTLADGLLGCGGFHPCFDCMEAVLWYSAGGVGEYPAFFFSGGEDAFVEGEFGLVDACGRGRRLFLVLLGRGGAAVVVIVGVIGVEPQLGQHAENMGRNRVWIAGRRHGDGVVNIKKCVISR